MKYIIEIENEPFGKNNDTFFSRGMDKLYKAKGFKSLVFDQDGLDKLTPYTEPGQKAIDLQHAHDIENVARMNYSKGTEDAWEFVRTVTDMTEAQRMQCFGGETCNLDEYLTYQEAKAKYDAWKKQKDEIRVGDEVEISGTIGIVTRVPYLDEERVHYIAKSGTVYCNNAYAEIKKTGRHFDEVEALLKKMGDEK